MKFSEKKAAELTEKYKLSTTTLNVWRHRDSIPDKYLTDLPHAISGEKEEQELKNLLKALNTDKFNVSSLCRLAGICRGIVVDFIRSKGLIHKDDLIAFKKAINTLRSEVKESLKVLDRRGNLSDKELKLIKNLLSRQELSWFVIIDRDRSVWNRISGWIDNRRPSFPYEDREKLKAAMLVFITETTI